MILLTNDKLSCFFSHVPSLVIEDPPPRGDCKIQSGMSPPADVEGLNVFHAPSCSSV